jgi:hypothetical protein
MSRQKDKDLYLFTKKALSCQAPRERVGAGAA